MWWEVGLQGGRAGAGRSTFSWGCMAISTTEVFCSFLQFRDNLLYLKNNEKETDLFWSFWGSLVFYVSWLKLCSCSIFVFFWFR